MAGGPIYPFSAFPVDAGKVFRNVHAGAGGNSDEEEGLGVMASVDADSTWRLRFRFPPTLPSGTCKLNLSALANAATGVAKVNPKWASVAAEEDASAATLNAEGTQTITWSTGDEDVYKEAEVNLDADTVVAGESCVMDLVFETTSWTLAVISTWNVFIHFED